MKKAEALYKSIRKPMPPPGKTHRDKTKYNRKKKHKKRDGYWQEPAPFSGPGRQITLDFPSLPFSPSMPRGKGSRTQAKLLLEDRTQIFRTRIAHAFTDFSDGEFRFQ